MTVQELIESGRLELYVAGALGVNEAREIAAMVKGSSALRSEVDAIERIVVKLLQAHRPVPATVLKNRIATILHNTA